MAIIGLILSGLYFGATSYTHKVYAISISISIGEVMAEMGSIEAYGLSVLETPDIFPHDLFVSKGWPSVDLAFFYKFCDCPSFWADEQGLTGHTVIVGHFGLPTLFEGLEPGAWLVEGIAGILGEVAIEVANFVSCLEVTPKLKVLLHWGLACSMFLF